MIPKNTALTVNRHTCNCVMALCFVFTWTRLYWNVIALSLVATLANNMYIWYIYHSLMISCLYQWFIWNALYAWCFLKNIFEVSGHWNNYQPREQDSWGQQGAHLGPVGPRWATSWAHEPYYQESARVNPVEIPANFAFWWRMSELENVYAFHCYSMTNCSGISYKDEGAYT